MDKLELLVTLLPSFPHFPVFARDPGIAGIRLNAAAVKGFQLDDELARLKEIKVEVPLYFDIKGRQMRVEEVYLNNEYLDLLLNHPIEVETPVPVLFKGGTDHALLLRVEEGGRRLIFQGGPQWEVRAGDSLCIRDPSLRVHGLFTVAEKYKIEKVKAAGFTRFFLSYVEHQQDVDQFLELVGNDSEVWLKIENPTGLEYAAREFHKRPNLVLVAAQGDLYTEVRRPHDILNALKLIIEQDHEACAGSRMLLSVAQSPVPSLADFAQLGFLHEIGFRRMMLCDEICRYGDWLTTAVNAFESFRQDYIERKI